uniref:Uncharacterized protein n=1 Tax=Candidatus Kentrum sp. TUN TaxID=2126343 RepID=A0A450ZWS1_9GAMM|nr:MAG: hypothetical protein BECKTUN1418F_GA0071002_107815 [Candidatus Kentron sp. TUN]VFK58207.1 MAG: hypothetical protein BECKTUN1418D_GA0071000_10782 [Candidatus Kentron sp. TUN]VFK62185.1 MAG: hypothetical protein BECKTUN1418E_GA0071001_107515 [Candidatus Kentron sp. TUN]
MTPSYRAALYSRPFQVQITQGTMIRIKEPGHPVRNTELMRNRSRVRSAVKTRITFDRQVFHAVRPVDHGDIEREDALHSITYHLRPYLGKARNVPPLRFVTSRIKMAKRFVVCLEIKPTPWILASRGAFPPLFIFVIRPITGS